MGTSEWAKRAGSVPRPPGTLTLVMRPERRSTAVKLRPTKRTVASRPSALAVSGLSGPDWAWTTQVVEADAPSKAVEPKSTDTVATSPGAAGSWSRPSSGFRSVRRPSVRRPIGARWAARVEYASKPSPRSNQRDPYATAEPRCTRAYAPNHVISVVVESRLGAANSSQVKASSDAAAGQYPSRGGSGRKPSCGRRPSRA